MKKIPITLEQYICTTCGKKWYINTEDKTDNKMTCPYGCEVEGNIARKFDMMINNYEEYVQDSILDDDTQLKEIGGE